MLKAEYAQEFLNVLGTITNKRAKIVIDHILEHGFITTEELETKYGYSHPPRAARDVREAGIPLETFAVKSTEGKAIAAYRFGDLSKIQHDKLGGRSVFSKAFKRKLYQESGGRCYICNGKFEMRYLQIDHRVPYEVFGDFKNFQLDIVFYMLLCASCNRAKSWSCEHCPNWGMDKLIEVCQNCYWGSPEAYEHIATQLIRRLELIWQNEEVQFFEELRKSAEEGKIELPAFVKSLIVSYLEKR